MEIEVDGYVSIGVADLVIDTESEKAKWKTILEVPNEENEIEEKETIYDIGMPLEINPFSVPSGTMIVIYKPKV